MLCFFCFLTESILNITAIRSIQNSESILTKNDRIFPITPTGTSTGMYAKFIASPESRSLNVLNVSPHCMRRLFFRIFTRCHFYNPAARLRRGNFSSRVCLSTGMVPVWSLPVMPLVSHRSHGDPPCPPKYGPRL